VKKRRVAQGLDTWQPGRPKGTCDKTTPEVRKQILRMVKDRVPITKIAKMLHLSRQTIYTVLEEEGGKE